MKKKDNVLTDKSVSLFRKKKVIISLTIIFLLLTSVIAIVSIYGLNTGGYTLSIDDKLAGMGISLSNTPDTKDEVSELTGKLKGDVVPIMQPQINRYTVLKNDGDFISNDGNYLGYTYYLNNSGTKECSVEATLQILGATHYLDETIRLWVFFGDDTEGTIYKKHEDVPADTYDDPNSLLPRYRETTDFIDNDVVCTRVFKNMQPGEQIKISIIMWIEGKDPDCIDEGDRSILGGLIKIGMGFSAYQEKII